MSLPIDDDDIETLIDAAAARGVANDLGRETSDLHRALSAAWHVMSETARQNFAKSHSVTAALEFARIELDGIPSSELPLACFIAAARHGAESDPDHEAGDLQDMLRDAWNLLDKAGRGAMWRHPILQSDRQPA